MQKLGFSGVKSLDKLRSITGSVQGSSKSFPAPPRSSDSISYGSFTNLKLTAEKLVKEQASVKTDLEMAHSKLKKSAENIRALELKLQETSNENAKLKVKQKEDVKLWKGLDSKLSSTKTFCDQLTETLQHLAGQVREAEEDKKFFEEKLSTSSKAFDDFQLQMNALSSKLESAEKDIRNRKQELTELAHEKGQLEKRIGDERCVAHDLIMEKDSIIKQLEATVEEDKSGLQILNSKLQEAHFELSSKEDICKCLKATQESLEKEKIALQSSNEDFAQKLLKSGQETKSLEDAINDLAAKIVELDKHSVTASKNVLQLTSTYDTCYKLVQQEKDLAAKHAQQKLDILHERFLHVASENNSFRAEIEELKNKVSELQKVHEIMMVQHAEECCLAEEKIQRLESEAENLVSIKSELEMLVTKLEEKVKLMSEASSLTTNQMQDLLLKISTLESENQDMQEKVQVTLEGKAEQIEALEKEIATRDEHVGSLENQVIQLHEILDEKERLHMQFEEKQKLLEEQRAEASLAMAENTLIEARKQYDLMLEGKQLELTKHLKEISQRNDQAINDIRRKYEVEKLEIVNTEKEKADKLIGEMERKYDEKIAENKEEACRFLSCVQEEHGALINRIQQENEKKESNLRVHHSEELQRVHLQAENELREKTTLLKKEHEVQMKAFRHQHEDECRKLQDELELQKSKEEKQRALLQLQWKVMGDSQHEDLEVNSKKEYSISSIKMKDADAGKGDQLALIRPENVKKNINFPGTMRTPMANLLKKVDKGNTGSQIDIPKHSKKVTRHEYEVETSNGRTITKRRKTKSTVMFGDPAMHKPINAKDSKNGKHIKKVQKVVKGARPCPTNIHELFTEGSLDPYADDPYAFD
ncbi:synaptonemal complex protein ZEP1-like isoform X2 [Magnolia sinica]|uniref:synaptonemal complex protein ZEP1-like isoform X2 n=1 Tax=Magnolia sinica TaxID=86752 RepID=UPI002659556E|nr:synaptonemal complex protein ZEP1-like isoform X2 [Magnolia sinica]